jgi:hypothetical protein
MGMATLVQVVSWCISAPCMANQTCVVGSMTAFRACAIGLSITCTTAAHVSTHDHSTCGLS